MYCQGSTFHDVPLYIISGAQHISLEIRQNPCFARVNYPSVTALPCHLPSQGEARAGGRVTNQGRQGRGACLSRIGKGEGHKSLKKRKYILLTLKYYYDKIIVIKYALWRFLCFLKRKLLLTLKKLQKTKGKSGKRSQAKNVREIYSLCWRYKCS